MESESDVIPATPPKTRQNEVVPSSTSRYGTKNQPYSASSTCEATSKPYKRPNERDIFKKFEIKSTLPDNVSTNGSKKPKRNVLSLYQKEKHDNDSADIVDDTDSDPDFIQEIPKKSKYSAKMDASSSSADSYKSTTVSFETRQKCITPERKELFS